MTFLSLLNASLIAIFLMLSFRLSDSLSPPVVIIYNQAVSNGQTVRLSALDTKVDVKCTGEGTVIRLTLKCGSVTQTSDSYGATFTVTYSKAFRSASCVCLSSLGYDEIGTSFNLVNGSTGRTALIWNILMLSSLMLGRAVLFWSTV